MAFADLTPTQQQALAAELTVKQLEVVVYRLAELSWREISRITGLPVTTVRGRWERAAHTIVEQGILTEEEAA